MATKFGDDEDVELELCLSLGGPFKKTEKSNPIETRTDGEFNGVTRAKNFCVNFDGEMAKREIIGTRRKETQKKREQRNGEGECKRIRTECNGVTNGVDLDLSFSKMDNGYGSGRFKENSKPITIGSPICSSSDVSDPSSSSRQEGGSCDFGVNSVHTKPVINPVNNIQTGIEETGKSTDGSNDAVVVETGKPPKPRPNGNGNGVNGSMLPFAQMPCVTSTGNGPEGKTVNGFLYRYSKSEISIICVCHGISFSPAEFIVHAGGTNVSHPLRHITVVPSAF
ncbi:unnamed protein product [Microthlaspi erraticum]|uniref:Ninja-family protein n=1 Tax=Microthlaspi erraticum TaxID=1685480 RepID=A0A6D2KPC0_9BRAS|nr:unnamed protein product [Microthlaspi erraticum]